MDREGGKVKYYTIAEFRKNLKEALELAIQGEEVYIDRLGQIFEVKLKDPLE